MGKVRLLDKHTAELIAAGEVVERPASVIKELVENSIDAGASVITVEIKSGGVSYMRITDDGEGIAHSDVPTAFLRHATSKISTGDDLASIATLGFRGEALASIAAVARVELITRTADEELGTHYVIEGGEELVYDECGCAKGTTIVVRDIFYNTPARMKFLKKDVAEGNAVASMLDRIALSHPEISVRLIREGKQVLMTSGDGQLKSAIHAVFGREFASGLIPVDYELKNVRVHGFISKPTQTRTNHVMQVFFINGRYCRSKTMQAALEEAYKGSIMVGKHPACVLNMDIDCSAVDVNVHPAKLEVRFTNERPIFDGVYYAVKSALSGGDSRREVKLGASRPAVVMPPEPPKPVQMTLPLQKESPAPGESEQARPARAEEIRQPETKPQQKVIFSDIVPVASGMEIVNDPGVESIAPPPAYPGGRKWTNINISADFDDDVTSTQETAQTLSDDAFLFGNAKSKVAEVILAEEKPDIVECAISEDVADVPQSVSPDASDAVQEHESEEAPNPFEMPSYRIIGEAFETYIMIESSDELILIDKHAAHERLIYERLVAQKSGREAQLLLEPLVITLDKQQYDVLLSNRDMMQEGGFEIEDFGFGAILIRSVPTVLADGDIEGAVMEIADNIGVKKDALMTRRMEDMYHTIACRSAIKAHDRSLEAEMEALVSQLIANPEVRYCPHGRPIYISLKKREIEKNFGRV